MESKTKKAHKKERDYFNKHTIDARKKKGEMNLLTLVKLGKHIASRAVKINLIKQNKTKQSKSRKQITEQGRLENKGSQIR
jgi:glucan-binding YG repeat protein